MDLFLYIIFAFVYIITIDLAIAIKGQFNLFIMTGVFILGLVLGYYLHSYEAGFVVAVVLSLIFW